MRRYIGKVHDCKYGGYQCSVYRNQESDWFIAAAGSTKQEAIHRAALALAEHLNVPCDNKLPLRIHHVTGSK